jgi:hypothetical protein
MDSPYNINSWIGKNLIFFIKFDLNINHTIKMSSDATVHKVGEEYLLPPTQSGIDKIKNNSTIQQWHTINLDPLTYTWANPQDAVHYQRLASRSFPAAAAFAREHGIINK